MIPEIRRNFNNAFTPEKYETFKQGLQEMYNHKPNFREAETPFFIPETLKEKLLAALRGGVKTVLIPEENVKDLQDIPENVKNNLEIVRVRWVDQVLEVALERMPQPLAEDEFAAAPTAATVEPA